MKKYIAIGHWRDEKNATICVGMLCNTKNDFLRQLSGNDFIPYVAITEKKFETLKGLDSFGIFKEVQKMTGNYRKWALIRDFIEQCMDCMEEKMANLK